MIRKTFTFRAYPDKVGEYIKRHENIWPDMVAMLREHGVTNYSLHLAEDGTTLFGYAEIASEAQWAAIAETDVCKRWWAEMAPLMATNEDNSPVSEPLREIFHLA